MWIPTHIFGVDFSVIQSEAALASISFVVENVTGEIATDMDEEAASIVKFGANGRYKLGNLKENKPTKLSNKARKILVYVVPKYSGVKVTSIQWKDEAITAPTEEGNGRYRYIDFDNENKETKNLVIRYQSQDGKSKKKKTIMIERSELSGNAKVTSVKVWGVEASFEDGTYVATLKKADTLTGKVEVALEDATCKYTVYTMEEDEDTGKLKKGDDVTTSDIDFLDDLNHKLRISIKPKLGVLYARSYGLEIVIEE